MRPDVVVVGAGPVGLTAANLLGQRGVSTVVVERNPSPGDLPKAVTLDDEALRTFQGAGLGPFVSRVIRPGTGTRYFGADHRPLVHVGGPGLGRHGHPVKNPFQQPELERALLAGVGRFPHVTVTFARSVVGLTQTSDEVIIEVESPDGRLDTIRAAFVLACDGGRSTVRCLLGVGLVGSSSPDRWVVIDTRHDPHRDPYARHVGDPVRPHVIVPGGDGRCRYEFLALPGDDAEPEPSLELVARLLAPYRHVGPGDVVRRATYSHHALIAQRWRVGRVLLLGDAAHMMPPFAGQGLNTGIRDAENVVWKLVTVLRGEASAAILDTYERERRPHTEATIRLSQRIGRIMMTRSRFVAGRRDTAVRTLLHLAPVRRYLEEGRFRPTADCSRGLVLDSRHPLLGRRLPQPDVVVPGGRSRPFDDVAGDGWVVVAGPAEDAVSPGGGGLRPPLGVRWLRVTGEDPYPERCSGWLPIGDRSGWLTAGLAGLGPRRILARPDRVVAAVFGPGEEAVVGRRLAAVLGGS